QARRGAGLPALGVYHVALSRRLCPFDFEIMEEARGRTLRAFDHDDALLRPLLEEMGRVLARVHGIGTRGFGFLDVRPLVHGEVGPARGLFPTWRDYVLVRFDEHLRTCVAIGAVSPEEARRIEQVFATLDDMLAGVEPALLHGDPGNHNVFTEDGAVTALIDWEDCLSGDPAFDIAFWA